MPCLQANWGLLVSRGLGRARWAGGAASVGGRASLRGDRRGAGAHGPRRGRGAAAHGSARARGLRPRIERPTF